MASRTQLAREPRPRDVLTADHGLRRDLHDLCGLLNGQAAEESQFHDAALYWIQMPETRVVHSDPDILGGTPVFVGTRVPLKSLFDYLEAGDSLDEFLDSFPSVTREQAVAALELARSMTEAHATAAR